MPSANALDATAASCRPGSPPICSATAMAAPTWSVIMSATSVGMGRPLMASATSGR